MWSLLGVKKSLGHTQIGLLQGFNFKCPTSIPPLFMWESPNPNPNPNPPPPPPRGPNDLLHHVLPLLESSVNSADDQEKCLSELYSLRWSNSEKVCHFWLEPFSNWDEYGTTALFYFRLFAHLISFGHAIYPLHR